MYIHSNSLKACTGRIRNNFKEKKEIGMGTRDSGVLLYPSGLNKKLQQQQQKKFLSKYGKEEYLLNLYHGCHVPIILFSVFFYMLRNIPT